MIGLCRRCLPLVLLFKFVQCELQYAKVWKPFPANRNNFQWSTDLQNTLRLYPTKTDANQNLAGAIIEDSTGKKVRTTLKISFGGLNQQGQRVNSRAARIYVYFYNDEPTSQDKTQANVRAGNGRYFLALPGDYLIKVVDTPGTGGVSCASQEKVRGSSGPKKTQFELMKFQHWNVPDWSECCTDKQTVQTSTRTYPCVTSVFGARSAVFVRTGRVLPITS